jgi:hypothetical protein
MQRIVMLSFIYKPYMLSVIMLNVVMLSVIRLNVIKLNVVASRSYFLTGGIAESFFYDRKLRSLKFYNTGTGFSSLRRRSVGRAVRMLTGLDRLDEPRGHVGRPVSRAAPGQF